MRAVIQRVSKASVTADDQVIGQINKGLLILFGVRDGDTEKEADILAKKCAGIRIFKDENDKMNLSPSVVGAEILVVSNFTLYADCSRGYRPNFSGSASADKAVILYEYFINNLKSRGFNVACGKFGAHMKLEISADGPVTIVIDTNDL